MKRPVSWLALVCLLAFTILSLRGGASALAVGAKAQKYSYYHEGKLVTLTPSENFVAVDESREAGFAFSRQLGLQRQPESDRAAFRSRSLGLYRTASPVGKGARPLSAASLSQVAATNGVIAEPVFEQGPALMIPGDEVIVGVKPGVSLQRTKALLQGYAKRYGFLSVTNPHGERIMVRINNPGDGRVFEISRFISGLPGVRYAEPNLIVHQFNGPAPAPQPAGKIPGPVDPNSLQKLKSTTPLPPAGYVIQANPTWTTIATTGFETDPGWFTGKLTGAVDALPLVVTTKKHLGTRSLYMSGGGTQGVPAPGPYPNNAGGALISPNFNLSTYEEVYVEFWFWAKYEDPGTSIFDYSYMGVANTTSGAFQALAFNVVSYTGDLTADPTTAGGWRRCLARMPPAFRVNGAQFQFIFFSDGSAGAEGVYIDDVRIVGTTNVDTEPLGTDTYGGRQYELRNVGQIAGLGTGSDDLNVPEAWAVQPISTSLILAIVDDGVDLTHPDLNLVTGYNGDNGSVGGGPLDATSFHGTACAGNAGAKRDNALGVAGTGAGVKIMPVNTGSTLESRANAINLAVAHGAQVLSNSWGWVGTPSQAITDAINAALAANRIVLFAAGNGPDRPPYTYQVAYPGSLTQTTNIITVGASSPTDEHKNASSSDGLHSWGSSYVGAGPDVCAPGPWSYTTDRRGAVGYNTDATATGVNADYEFQFGGTSSSTPKVAGIVALMLSKNSTLTPAQVKTILKNTAADIDATGADDRTGNGRVDALAAVNAVAAPGFSISGTVKLSNGTGVAGVTVTAGGKTATTAATTGAFTITGVAAGTYPVTPSRAGYTFNPANTSVTVGPNKTGVNFVATPVFSITGAIKVGTTGLASVTVAAGGKTATTNTSGVYTIAGLPAATYTVTPTRSGYTFTPASKSVALTANASGVDFAATAVSGFSIAGKVTLAAGGAALANVVVAGGGKSTTTNATGDYTLAGLAAGTQIVTARLAGYTISPASRKVVVGPNKTGVNFTAVASFSISGKVSQGTVGLAGVSMRATASLPRVFTSSATPGTAIPDNNTTGIESILTAPALGTLTNVRATINIPHSFRGDLQVALVHPDGTSVMLFDGPRADATENLVATFPTNRTPVQPLTAFNGKAANGAWRLRVKDLAASDTGTLTSWTLELTYGGAVSSAATTAADGTYTLAGLAPGTYSVIPVKTGFTFSPTSQSVAVGPNKTGINFTATAALRSLGSVAGVVKNKKGKPMLGAQVRAGGKSTVTTKGGEYLIEGLKPGAKVTVRVQKKGARFSPDKKTVKVTEAVSRANFRAK